jgi:hypothetical protein
MLKELRYTNGAEGALWNCAERNRLTWCDSLDNGHNLAKEEEDMETTAIVPMLIVPNH